MEARVVGWATRPLAGIPEISWKRSFDICSARPSRLEIQPRAVLDYLHRKVPEKLRAIRKADGNVEEIRDIVRRRTNDRQLIILSDQAAHVMRYLEQGKPRSPSNSRGT